MIDLEEVLSQILSEMKTMHGDIKEIKGDITVMKGDITAMQGDIKVMKSDITTMQDDIKVMKGDITTMQGDIKVMKGDITTMQGDIKVMKGDITTINNRLDNLENDMAFVKPQVSENTEILKALVHSSQVQKAQIDSIEYNVAHISGDMEDIKTDLSLIEGISAKNWSDVIMMKKKFEKIS